MRAAPDPRALTRVVWGLTSRPPVSPAGFPPVSRLPAGFSPSPAFPRFPFVRRSPVRSLRPLPGSGSPPVSLRVPFALSDFYLTAAAGRFPGHWSRAAGTKVTSSAATTSPRIARSARTADGQRLSTMGCHRIACYGRPRATGHRRARTAQIGGSVGVAPEKLITQRCKDCLTSVSRSPVRGGSNAFGAPGSVTRHGRRLRCRPRWCAAARWQARGWRHGDGRWPGRPQDHRRRGDRLVPGAYGCPDDGSVKVWAAGRWSGRLLVKIHVSRLKYFWPGCPGHGLARHKTVRMG